MTIGAASDPNTYVVPRDCQNETRMKRSFQDNSEGSKMHILALAVTAMTLTAVWYWRVKALHSLGSEVFDVAGRLRGAYRRFRFRQKAEGSVLSSVDDPALAAAILLFAIAEEGGPSPAAEVEIGRQISLIAAPDRLDEIMAYASWAARQGSGPRQCLHQFSPLWRAHLTDGERQHLVRMAETIGQVANTPARPNRFAVETLQSALSS